MLNWIQFEKKKSYRGGLDLFEFGLFLKLIEIEGQLKKLFGNNEGTNSIYLHLQV